ncbi:hypothetical protein GTY76_40545 [Streptomyces sp. SID4951]|nr:hypothetical protein [Streptomyces sp. SID4951]
MGRHRSPGDASRGHDRTDPRNHLDNVSAELNCRPRKTLGRETPAERLPELLAATHQSSSVATTPGTHHNRRAVTTEEISAFHSHPSG